MWLGQLLEQWEESGIIGGEAWNRWALEHKKSHCDNDFWISIPSEHHAPLFDSSSLVIYHQSQQLQVFAMPRLSFALVGVILPLSVIAVPLFDVGSPEWKAGLKDGILPKEKFCKANTDSIEALLKDPAGTAYCLNVIDLHKTTL